MMIMMMKSNQMLIENDNECDVDYVDDDIETVGSPRAILDLGQILSKTNQIKSCNFMPSSMRMA